MEEEHNALVLQGSRYRVISSQYVQNVINLILFKFKCLYKEKYFICLSKMEV